MLKKVLIFILFTIIIQTGVFFNSFYNFFEIHLVERKPFMKNVKHIFIVNPMAGKGKTADEISAALNAYKAEYDIDIYPTAGKGDAIRYIKDILCNGDGEITYRFYACGGDGSLNEVVNGVLGSGRENYEVCPFPCGSGNDFVKALGGKEKYSDIGVLLKAKSRKIDAIRAGNDYAVNAVHFGFDTKVAIVMQLVKSKPIIGGRNAYTTGIVVGFFNAMKNDCTLIADGEEVLSGKFLLCTLANGQYVGGQFKCAPRSEYDDGLIEVCMVKTVSRLRFLTLIKYYEQGTHLEADKFKDILIYKQAKKLTLSSVDKDFAYSLDGEVVSGNNIEIEVLPGVLNMVIPED